MKFLAGVLHDLGFLQCTMTPQFYYDERRGVGLEAYADGLRGFGSAAARTTFLTELASRITIKLRGLIAYGEPYLCLKRKRVIEEHETRILVRPLCPNDVVRVLGEGARSPAPVSGVDGEETEADCELITPEMRCVYRSCVNMLV